MDIVKTRIVLERVGIACGLETVAQIDVELHAMCEQNFFVAFSGVVERGRAEKMIRRNFSMRTHDPRKIPGVSHALQRKLAHRIGLRRLTRVRGRIHLRRPHLLAVRASCREHRDEDGQPFLIGQETHP